jgi:hypothetical protein
LALDADTRAHRTVIRTRITLFALLERRTIALYSFVAPIVNHSEKIVIQSERVEKSSFASLKNQSALRYSALRNEKIVILPVV